MNIKDFENKLFNPQDASTFKLKDVDAWLAERCKEMIIAAKKASREVDYSKLKLYFGELYIIPQCTADRIVERAKEELEI
jgi:hypothetical protein